MPQVWFPTLSTVPILSFACLATSGSCFSSFYIFCTRLNWTCRLSSTRERRKRIIKLYGTFLASCLCCLRFCSASFTPTPSSMWCRLTHALGFRIERTRNSRRYKLFFGETEVSILLYSFIFHQCVSNRDSLGYSYVPLWLPNTSYPKIQLQSILVEDDHPFYRNHAGLHYNLSSWFRFCDANVAKLVVQDQPRSISLQILRILWVFPRGAVRYCVSGR